MEYEKIVRVSFDTFNDCGSDLRNFIVDNDLENFNISIDGADLVFKDH